MKKMLLAVTILVLASLAMPAHAADLQAGWYVKVSSVYIDQYDQQGNLFIREQGFFYSTPPGQYGPFQVTDGTYHNPGERYVSVPATVSAGTGDSLVMPLSFGMTLGEPIAYLSFGWETNYDPSHMRLEFWRENYYTSVQELLWAQSLSGYRYGGAAALTNATYDSRYFVKVAVMPEPSSFMVLAAGVGLLSGVLWRRR